MKKTTIDLPAATPEIEVVDVAKPAIGDIVLYHEMRGPVPAIVQFIYPDGSLRLWIWGAQSMHPKDGVIEGTEQGQWKRKP